jgi:hypothetical protein
MTTIERLIPAEWRKEIVVLDAGVLTEERAGYPRGTDYARIGAVDWISWRQAITTLSPHGDNEIGEWLAGGERGDGYEHVITVWNPTISIKHRAIPNF